jgi:glutathione S-transferase
MGLAGSGGVGTVNREAGMTTLYSMQRSGNCYKVRLALAQLNIPYRLVEIDILRGETRTPEFLAKNPNGHVPLLEVSPGRFLPESGAILWYLAGVSPLAPDNRIDRAETLQWMFFEQHSLEPYIGEAHFWLNLVKGGRELQIHAVEDWLENGYRGLQVMDKHLTKHRFFAADRYTIADISLYGYTHIANECDFDLTGFPAIRSWLKRVADQPGQIRIDWHPTTMPLRGEVSNADGSLKKRIVGHVARACPPKIRNAPRSHSFGD